MLRRVVPAAGPAQWPPGGHRTPDSPGRSGGDPQIALVRRALRKVSTAGHHGRWHPARSWEFPHGDRRGSAIGAALSGL